MTKIIKIGSKEVRLDNSVAWTMEYKDQFGKDIIPVLIPAMSSIVEALSAIVAETGVNNLSAEGNAETGVKKLTAAGVAEALQGRTMEILMPMYQMEFVDVVIGVTWAMAKAADEDIDPPKKWVRQFDAFPLDTICPAVYELVLKGFVSSKNLKRLKELGKNLKKLQPSLSKTSSSQEQNED